MSRTVTKKRSRLVITACIGVVVGCIAVVIGSGWILGCLAGWDAAALSFIGSVLWDFSGHSREGTARIAKSLDLSGWTLDAVVIVAALASLVAVGALLSASGSDRLLRVGFGLVSIVLGWASVHMLFMLRYAAVYYQGKNAIDFNDREAPKFSDFAYLAFTIGMTYQVSDTNFQSSAMRKVALGHALISFVFGTVIIATTINLVAGLIG
ncbi:MAG TPA: DUF1345 domain-containing protein [Candidatus Saccharimonadaceae bacterium]|nr:DUF1345 domain-containing protein [Candidatus Saccharimonadaceae bacterium]